MSLWRVFRLPRSRDLHRNPSHMRGNRCVAEISSLKEGKMVGIRAAFHSMPGTGPPLAIQCEGARVDDFSHSGTISCWRDRRFSLTSIRRLVVRYCYSNAPQIGVGIDVCCGARPSRLGTMAAFFALRLRFSSRRDIQTGWDGSRRHNNINRG